MENGYSICFNEWAVDKSIKTELGLLLIISGLTAKKGYCYANNKYFSDLFDVDETTISRRISKLSKKGYIKIDYIKAGGIVIERKIRLAKTLSTVSKNANGTVSKSAKDNNTSINNKTPNPLKGEIDFDVLISIINKATGKSYRVINNATKKKYLKLLKEGYTKEDIRNAIKNSINDQYHKETKLKYLTPEFFSRPTTIDKYAFKSRFKQPNSSTSKGML